MYTMFIEKFKSESMRDSIFQNAYETKNIRQATRLNDQSVTETVLRPFPSHPTPSGTAAN